MWRTDERGPGGCRKTMKDTDIATHGRGDGGWDEDGEGGRREKWKVRERLRAGLEALGQFRENLQVSSLGARMASP